VPRRRPRVSIQRLVDRPTSHRDTAILVPGSCRHRDAAAMVRFLGPDRYFVEAAGDEKLIPATPTSDHRLNEPAAFAGRRCDCAADEAPCAVS